MLFLSALPSLTPVVWTSNFVCTLTLRNNRIVGRPLTNQSYKSIANPISAHQAITHPITIVCFPFPFSKHHPKPNDSRKERATLIEVKERDLGKRHTSSQVFKPHKDCKGMRNIVCLRLHQDHIYDHSWNTFFIDLSLSTLKTCSRNANKPQSLIIQQFYI